MNNGNKNRFQFGDFELDADERILRHQGEIVPLQARVFDVLSMLVERRGGVVSKDELMETIWAGSFVEESNITQSIYSLRKLLDRDGGRSMIETVPKRGYRMATPVASAVDRRLPAEPANYDRPSGRRYRPSLAIALGLILLAVFAASGFIASRYFNPTRTAPVESVKFEKLTFSGDIAFPIIAPDGKAFAFVRDNAIHLQDVANGSSVKLSITDHQKFGNLQFSAEGESIYFRDEDSFDASGNLFQVSRFGGRAKLVAERVWSTVGFSPDGKRMAFVRFFPTQGEWALIVRATAGGEEQKLFTRNLPFTIYRTGFPAWSQDGKRIAIIEQSPNQRNTSSLILVDASSGSAQTIPTPDLIQIEQVAWLPGDASMLVTGRENNRFFQLWKLSLADRSLQRITNDLNNYRTLSVSLDGHKMIARQFAVYSHIWTLQGTNLEEQKQITFGNLNRDGAAGMNWTPDGRIIYATRITGNIDLWSLRPEDGVRKALTENAGPSNENPFVSADGKFVFFESSRGGKRRIWRIDSDGSNPTQVSPDDDNTDYLPVVSHDGTTVFYIQRNPKGNVLWRQTLADGTREMLTEQGKLAPGSFLSFSPDGRYLAFKSQKEENDTDTADIVFLDLTGASEPRIINLKTQNPTIEFSDGGLSFDYVDNQPDAARLWRQPIGKGERRLLLELPKERIFSFAWDRDGKTLALGRGRQQNDAMLLTGF